MATSGTSTFNLTRDQIITNALQLLGIVGSGQTAQTNDLTFCASLLNSMVKAWEGQGIHLWTEEEGTIYLVNGQSQYILPGLNNTLSPTANAGDGTGTPVETTLSQAGTSGLNTITCTSVTGMSINDNIGIELSTTLLQWTTIQAINVSSNVVTLNANLSSNANQGNLVATYTTAMNRPLTITSARVRDINNVDRPIDMRPREEFQQIPQKTIAGDPYVIFYNPQLTNGVVTCWPTPNDVSKRLKVTYWRTLQDFNSGTDNADFPQEWMECLIYNLAVRAAPSYGINLSSGGFGGNPDILRQATQYLEDLKAFDADDTYVRIIPNYRFRRY